MSPRRRRPPVNRHFKIDLLVKPEDLAAYRSFLREPATTVDTSHAWPEGTRVPDDLAVGGRAAQTAVPGPGGDPRRRPARRRGVREGGGVAARAGPARRGAA